MTKLDVLRYWVQSTRIQTDKIYGAFHPFPLDMLRYNQCWPATQAGIESIMAQDGTEIEINGIIPPTVDRWSSFGWLVRTDPPSRRRTAPVPRKSPAVAVAMKRRA